MLRDDLLNPSTDSGQFEQTDGQTPHRHFLRIFLSSMVHPQHNKLPNTKHSIMTTVQERQQAVEVLIQQGARWNNDNNSNGNGNSFQHLLDVSYSLDSPRQKLDIYFVAKHFHAAADVAVADADDDSTTGITRKERVPIFIHIHGGGWSRGSKNQRFYGAPAVAKAAVSSAVGKHNNGCIAITPNYRRGEYPLFMKDAAAAIQWVWQNAQALGGDLSQLFLCGHSAGAHIASLLVLRHDEFLQPLQVPVDFVQGIILLSGVYDLFRPLQQSPWLDVKNKWFLWVYVWPAFGWDKDIRHEASPLLLLTALEDGSSSSSIKINTTHWPPTLILNATFDMGLQENGQRMRDALEKYTSAEIVEYSILPNTDHASICWNEGTAAEIKKFIREKCCRKG